jgi:hypothetical protein
MPAKALLVWRRDVPEGAGLLLAAPVSVAAVLPAAEAMLFDVAGNMLAFLSDCAFIAACWTLQQLAEDWAAQRKWLRLISLFGGRPARSFHELVVIISIYLSLVLSGLSWTLAAALQPWIVKLAAKGGRLATVRVLIFITGFLLLSRHRNIFFQSSVRHGLA